MVLTTRYTELTGCRAPIQQAPMGSVSTSALAVAVADAGGVGSITALGMTAAELDEVLAGMTARTTGVLAANFLTGRIDPEAVAAAATGHVDAMPMYAGESAAHIGAVEPAEQIIRSWAGG